MKKILLSLIALMVFSSIAMASPLMDYSQGKGSFDISVRPNMDVDLDFNGQVFLPNGERLDGKSSNLDYNLTLGLGKDLAVQFRLFEPATKSHRVTSFPNPANNLYDSDKSSYKEFNILHKISNNVSAFVGYIEGQSTRTRVWTNSAPFSVRPSETIKQAQIGLLGSAKLSKELALYGSYAVASGIINAEAGLSHKLSPNTELSVSYRYISFSSLNFPDSINGDTKVNLTTKGIGYGITCKL